MKTIDVRITFDCDDGSFERGDARTVHSAILRAYPYLRESEVTVEEIDTDQIARRIPDWAQEDILEDHALASALYPFRQGEETALATLRRLLAGVKP